MAHICNPSTLGGGGGWHKVRSSRPAWPTQWNPDSTKNTKITWTWWHVPIIPATWRLRRKNGLNWRGGSFSELRSRHCTPAWVTDSASKKKKVHFPLHILNHTHTKVEPLSFKYFNKTKSIFGIHYLHFSFMPRSVCKLQNKHASLSVFSSCSTYMTCWKSYSS